MQGSGYFRSSSPDETLGLAQRLGAEFSNILVLLYGGLGAGKTLFARGYSEGLGIKANVSSPSYSLMNEYIGQHASMFHFDLYRLNCLEEVVDIGLFDILGRGGACLVEWPERVAELAKLPHLEVKISALPDFSLETEDIRDIYWSFKN